MKVFIFGMIFLFLLGVGILLFYNANKEKMYKKNFIISEKSATIHSLNEIIYDTNNILLDKYIFCWLFFANYFSLEEKNKGIFYKQLLLQKVAIPAEIDKSSLSCTTIEFFSYKGIETEEKNIFFLTLIKEKACFKLNHIQDLRSCMGFICEFSLINDNKLEDLDFQETYHENIFEDMTKETFDQYEHKNNMFYLPIKIEKITIKITKITH